MQLEPYLFFYGNCEEALNFYKSALDGEIVGLMRAGEAPPDVQQHMPGVDPKSVMHSTFKANGFSFMAADGNPTTKATDSNITLALAADDEAQARNYFDRLAEGGKVTMPFTDAFWGGKFGSITDKFGMDWFITSPQ